ncbi:unnamed protein product [Hermetia illucens]|uniref:Kazal-like domain-containing protein n=1 Tax=Hermetia illucens TaxID=343691 RepID=A0A7R8UIL1_HERIL|nr:unnamed protein product [Hermetia illucens]
MIRLLLVILIVRGEAAPSECQQSCNFGHYEPVCCLQGNHKMTFTSKCLADMLIYNNDNFLTILHDGPCVSD